MLDIFNIPTPQSSNYQEFYGGGTTRDWIKPRGASMVRMMLIGAGGGGGYGSSSSGGGGGGSGAITSWIGPAIFIPDILQIYVAKGGISGVSGENTTVVWQGPSASAGYTLLIAQGGSSGSTTVTAGTGGAAMTNNYFGAAGIFTSIAGQNGSNGGSTGAGIDVLASSTTFLSAGAGGSGGAANVGGSVATNYGYPTSSNATAGGTVKGADGFFITQPILVGRGGAGGTTNTTGQGSLGGNAGIGCGGGGYGEDAFTLLGAGAGRGGDGAVFIWSW